MFAKFETQSPAHNNKRLKCVCGSFNWKIEEHPYLTRFTYICAECGTEETSDLIEDQLREERRNP